MIGVRVDREYYTHFKEATVSIDMDNLCGSFSIISSADKNSNFPLRLGDYVEVAVDEVKILSGYVEKLEISYDAYDHEIRVSGRSIIADIIDSTTEQSGLEDVSVVNGKLVVENIKSIVSMESNGKISLEKIIRRALDGNNMMHIKVINNAGTINDFTEEDVTSPEIDESIYDFIEKLACKRQVLINSDESGNIVLNRGAGGTLDKGSFTLLNKLSDKSNNNIKSASLERDNSKQYYLYLVHSSTNPINLERKLNGQDDVDIFGYCIDPDVRFYRRLDIKTEESTDKKHCDERVIWEKNIRQARSFVYTAIVQGHTVNNEPYKINTLVNVIDDFCGLNGTLLVKGVKFNYSLDDGSTTELTCVPKDSYLLSLEGNKFSKKTKLSTEEQYERAVKAVEKK